jgi:tetratricopeptide (TPR) repeat protein
VNHRLRLLVVLAFLGPLWPFLAFAQKPSPTPTPTPPPTTSGPTPSGATLANTQPVQTDTDYILFIYGHIGANDATALPQNVSVELVCNQRVRKQVFTSPEGDFTLQFGTPTGPIIDASDDTSSRALSTNNNPLTGISRRSLSECELRTSAVGFLTNNLALMGTTPTSSRTLDVGNVMIERLAKVKGTTISAVPYKTTESARKAYEKGLAAQKNGKIDDAHKDFEDAVKLNPRYAAAWFRLGIVLEKQNQTDPARDAYSKATAIDPKFLPPYLSLASLALKSQNWTSVLQYTNHVIAVDPLNYGTDNTFIVDLDEWNPADAYFYNALANFKLDRFDDSEKSALKAANVDLRDHAPQVHLLLAELFARKQQYSRAISELQTYLQLVPRAPNADAIRTQIANLEQLNHASPSS